jgi:hypothetical protein
MNTGLVPPILPASLRQHRHCVPRSSGTTSKPADPAGAARDLEHLVSFVSTKRKDGWLGIPVSMLIAYDAYVLLSIDS